MNGDDFCLSFFEKKLSGDCQILNANLVFPLQITMNWFFSISVLVFLKNKQPTIALNSSFISEKSNKRASTSMNIA